MIILIKKVYRYILWVFFKNIILKSKISDKLKFELIYKYNYWGNKSSVSGTGSAIENTENVRKELRNIIKKYNIKSILDVPCGDFNWMKLVLNFKHPPKYIGGDIVENLVKKLNKSYKDKNIDFHYIDITKSNLPKVDLLICRDCLIHFSNENVKKTISNFIKSEIKYLLISDSVIRPNLKNDNIKSGEYRYIDLTSEPFNLPKDNLLSFNDVYNKNIQSFETKMTLWHRDQIKDVF